MYAIIESFNSTFSTNHLYTANKKHLTAVLLIISFQVRKLRLFAKENDRSAYVIDNNEQLFIVLAN